MIDDKTRACVRCKKEKTESEYLRPRIINGGVPRKWRSCAACMKIHLSNAGKESWKIKTGIYGEDRISTLGTVLCLKCNQWKPFSSFTASRDVPGMYKSSCKDCESLAARVRSQERKQSGVCTHCGKRPIGSISKVYCDHCKKIQSKSSLDNKRKNKAKAIQLLGGKCVDCGLRTDKHAVYDFHHLPGEPKTAEIGNLLFFKWATIVRELRSCVLLCANCHRIRHAEECLDEDD